MSTKFKIIKESEYQNLFKEIEDIQNTLNKIFAYFYDHIDPMTKTGNVNSKLNNIYSVEDLIKYYNEEMMILNKEYYK